jgi:predicted DNA-binding transcriptional regulator AlpA
MRTSTQPQKLASGAEVAGMLGIPEKTLTQWRSDGKGPEYLKIGRYVRYRWDAVNEWLATREAGKGAA